MERADIICVGNLGVPLVNVSYNGKSKSRFIGKHLGRTSWTACPSFSLSLLFMPLGAVLCLFRLVGAECNINALLPFRVRKARTDALQEAVDQYLARALRRGESPAPPAGREDAGGAET